MDFKQEILQALQSANDYHTLLDIVRRYTNQGLPPEMCYKLLEEIWRELGLDQTLETRPCHDYLEYAMEKVWYQGASV